METARHVERAPKGEATPEEPPQVSTPNAEAERQRWKSQY